MSNLKKSDKGMIYDDNGSNTFFAILSALRIDLYDDRMRNRLKI